MKVRNANDGTNSAPYLRIDLNGGNLLDLPDWSIGPKQDDPDLLHKLKDDGFDGVQGWNRTSALEAGMKGATAAGRINHVGEIADMAHVWKSEGFDLATLHVGWGIESDDEIDALVNDIIETSFRLDFPLYIETHRATIAQDNYRTVKMVERNPDVRFNGDFSHFYTGHEMPYGDFEAKVDFIQPILDRTSFMHGRIGNSSNMQVRWSDPSMELAREHFAQIWTRVFKAWKANAQPGDFFCFTPEIIPFRYGYVRMFPDASGVLQEESDRYADALKMVEFAKQCWNRA